MITQKCEAKLVIQDVAAYEQTQETMAPLKILALDNREIFFKSYRLIYRTGKRRVHVYLIVGGRRNMRSLLARSCIRLSSISRDTSVRTFL